MLSANSKGHDVDNEDRDPGQTFVPVQNFVSAEGNLAHVRTSTASLAKAAHTRRETTEMMTIPTLQFPLAKWQTSRGNGLPPTEAATRYARQGLSAENGVEDAETEHRSHIEYARDDHTVVPDYYECN